MLQRWVEQDNSGQKLNLAIANGDNVALSLQVDTAPNVPLDLTGALVIMTIGFPGAAVTFSTENGGITINSPSTNGNLTVNMTSTQTAAFPVEAAPYDFWIYPAPMVPSGTQYFRGKFIVHQSITPLQ